MVFLIDLPRFETQQTTAGTETLFGKELRRFLTALGIGEKLVKSLDNYDFSETSRYGFVHTMSVNRTRVPAKMASSLTADFNPQFREPCE